MENREISKPKSEEVINAQREIIQGYFNWIMLDKPDVELILDRLQADLQYIREEQIVLDAENIINSQTSTDGK